MVDFILLVLFAWLFYKAVRLVFRATWGLTKFLAMLLLILALPTMIGILLVASGVALLFPVLLLWAVVALLKH